MAAWSDPLVEQCLAIHKNSIDAPLKHSHLWPFKITKPGQTALKIRV
jgi:hypothetical protein